jgi:dipeptidyl-peptidase-3
MTSSQPDLSTHVILLGTPLSALQAQEAFAGLSAREKLYCHYLARAAWEGAPICLLQTSPESVPVFLLLKEVFSRQTPASLRAAVQESVTEDEFRSLLLYTAAVFTNMGNYKGFGDTKIIPGIPRDKMEVVLQASVLFREDSDLVSRLWGACSSPMYSLLSRERQLGLGDEGINTYYSGNCTRADAELVQAFLKEKGLEAYNTRVFKTVDEGGKTAKYELRFASATTANESLGPEDDVAPLLGDHTHNSAHIVVTRGDYAPLMEKIARNLEQAKLCVSNEEEAAMLECYTRSFRSGSLAQHKQGSRHWIRNKGPIVETYMGFIESYRDPFGVRGEFEGFVAVVNKAMSSKFQQLVQSAENLLTQLPWPREFEKDQFLRPDFTSLDIVAFAGSGVPAGINIPNYDEIRQNEGFKNVSLGNVLQAAYQDKRVSFLSPEDQELFVNLRGPAFEVQVGLHELLGHGSGKLFRIDETGTFNFDSTSVKNPFTGEKITSWYRPGETYDTRFSSLASTYEECRAECVGLYLCLNRDVLKVFGHVGPGAEDILYVNWLNMVRAGVLGLEFYTPDTKKWGQAHMQARHVILRLLLERGGGLVGVKRVTGSDDRPDILVTLDRSLIETRGRSIIQEFLLKLQVYRSTGDFDAASSLYEKYSAVSEDGGWLELREVVMARKLPRRMLIQPLTQLQGGQL